MSDEAGDFDAVLAAHAAMIDRILRTYELRPAVRADLRQDVALALWQALPRYRGEAAIKTFVARIAHNIGVSHVRRDVREPAAAPVDEALPSPAPPAEEAIGRAQQSERLAEAIRSLPLGLRQAVALYLEDFSNADIAATLGISEGATAVRLTRARDALAARMGAP
ncbi:MAG: RNA polymerase sigma factor [Gammaproteobacteria bacterium]